MHYCCATVKLSGGHHTHVPRTEFNPVSWPEIEIIRAIHGDDAVIDVKPFVFVEQTPKAEKERLLAIYGGIVEDVFPGRNPRMEMDAAGAKLPDPTPQWRNPVEKDPVSEFEFTAPAPEAKPAAKPKAAANPF